MKTPLHYQITNYDCGPTSVLNALSFLFEREEIPPVLIRNIMLYCLDCYDSCGEAGKMGTSRSAMMFLSHWMQGFGETGRLPISSQYLSGSKVYLGIGSELNKALRAGGAIVIRLFLDEWHYILLTGIDEYDKVQAFDPYLSRKLFVGHPEVTLVEDKPYAYNRLIPMQSFNEEEEGLYALGPKGMREAVIIYNNNTKRTVLEEQIEYYI